MPKKIKITTLKQDRKKLHKLACAFSKKWSYDETIKTWANLIHTELACRGKRTYRAHGPSSTGEFFVIFSAILSKDEYEKIINPQ